MSEADIETKRKREYHRKWRKEHPESVRAAQLRYWAKKAEEMRSAGEVDFPTGPQEEDR